jgi:FkbM family methyltransferase
VIGRLARVALRFAATGQFSSSPTPIIHRKLSGGPAFFVQVGSNDGVRGDPLHHLIKANALWRGIFIEPVDYLFKRLVANYGASERFVFEQIAVAEQAGEREFYYVSEQASKDPRLPPMSDQLGSFDRSHITNHSALLDFYIVSKKVRCEPLESLLSRYNVEHIDIIHIDTEGYDYNVLRQIDFSKHKPRLVLFEHAHLKRDTLSKSRAILKLHGYRLVNCGLDTLAVS